MREAWIPHWAAQCTTFLDFLGVPCMGLSGKADEGLLYIYIYIYIHTK